jgi:cytochrome P450
MTALATAQRPLAPVSLRELRDVDPYPAYERIRAVGPVVWDEGMVAWLVLSHDACTFVERREDLFEELTGTLPGAAEIVGRRDFRSLVGAEHETLHRSLSHAWRPDPIGPLAAAMVRPLVAERIARLAGRPAFELYEDLARLLPIAVVAGVLGLSEADSQTLERAKGWMEAVLAWRHSYGEDPEARAEAIVATKRLEPILLETVRARHDRPEHDVISLLWSTGREVAPNWGEQDVLDNAKFLFEGGSETTAFLICTAIQRVLELPVDRRVATLADPLAFARFLEEVLRHSTVVHLRARRAMQGVDLGGVTVHAGERVIAVNAAANRDPARWERPDELDPDRARLWGHLAFNVGPRHCAGSHLARMEATETIGGLFRAFPDLARAEGAPEPVPMGFVSRAWRPVELVHAPVPPDLARERIAAGPVWAGSVPSGPSGAVSPERPLAPKSGAGY